MPLRVKLMVSPASLQVAVFDEIGAEVSYPDAVSREILQGYAPRFSEREKDGLAQRLIPGWMG